MIEQIYQMSSGDQTAVEKVVFDENIHYLHMLFNCGEGLPIHLSNSNVYMTVIAGTLSLGLDEQEINTYHAKTLLKIPLGTKMNVRNLHETSLELIVVKAPAPNMAAT